MITINGIEGHIIPGDIGYLTDICRELPPSPTVVEIGSWKGLTCTIMANARPDATIHCVDTWRGSTEHRECESVKNGTLFLEFQENVRALGDIVTPWPMDSAAAAGLMEHKKFDLLFIDGDHSKDGCLLDLNLWVPKVKPGGIILVHDCNDPGVSAALGQYGADYRLTEPPAAHYMGRLC